MSLPGDLMRSIQTRALKVRVPDPLAMGIRRNGPPDGWLSDGLHYLGERTFGDWAQDGRSFPQLPNASFWLGQDSWGGGSSDDYCDNFDGWGGGSSFDAANGGVLPSVTRCQMVIVNSVVRTPWVYEQNQVVKRLPLWVRDPMLLGRSPGVERATLPHGRRLSGFAFWSTVLSHQILWGRSAIVYEQGSSGSPVAGTLRILNPYLVAPSDSGWTINPGAEKPVETDFDGNFRLDGSDWRLAVFRGMAPNDGVIAEGVMTRHWRALRLATAVSQYTADLFQSGIPSGYLRVLTPNFPEKQALELKAKFMAAHGAGAREVAVLNAAVEYQPISISPTDAKADELTRLSRSDVALMFNLDPVFVGEGTSGLTYQNKESRREDLVDLTTSAWGALLCETVSSMMPHGHEIRVNWALFTSANFEEQIGPMVQAIEAGLMTPDEARQRMGLGAVLGAPPEEDNDMDGVPDVEQDIDSTE